MTEQEQNVFGRILDSDETIVESFKPNKTRAVILPIIRNAIGSLILIIIGALIAVFGANMTDENGNPVNGSIIGIVVIGIGVLIMAISIIVELVKFSKLYYCYTNKRVIIRSGVIGADFQTIDYKLLGGMNVRVDFLDKLVHPNTGTIFFSSAAGGMLINMMNRANGQTPANCFFGIQNPYDVYKRIKEYSEQQTKAEK